MKNRNNLILVLLVLAFFISGAGALIYQILWVKILSLTFGSTTLAVTTILASFMGGLALGSFLMAKYAKNIKNVILAYAYLEFGIASYALLIPLIFQFTDILYRFIWPITSGDPFLVSLIRFILTAIVLIIPTTLMGATLPILVKQYINKEESIVKFISILYGVNTLGAVFGCFFCGFYLIEAFGISSTNLIAVSFSLIAALAALKLNSLSSEKTEFIVKEECSKFKFNLLEQKDKFILIAMLLSGISAMVYEVVWSRQLVLIFGSTTFAYTSMLGIFLVGISVGSFVVNKSFNNNEKNIYLFGILEILIGLLVIFGAFYYNFLLFLYFKFTVFFGGSLFLAPIIIVSFLLIAPPAIIFGMLFPLAVKLFNPQDFSVSERTGQIYSFNTLGCIIGSISAGFILIPILGLKYSLMFAVFINILIGFGYIFAFAKYEKVKTVTIPACILLLIALITFQPQWNKDSVALSPYLNKAFYVDLIKEFNYNSLQEYFKTSVVKYYKEGQHSTIAVAEYQEDNNTKGYSLYNNGKVDASTSLSDMRTQAIVGYLPAFLTDKLDDILVVGMGSGISVSVIEKFNLKTIELIELEKAIIDARTFFSSRYGDPLLDKRIKVIIDDARNYLRVVNKKYDVIISEPSNVWVSGVASLFTENYYSIIKSKLKPEGFLCQWIQAYMLQPEAVMSVLKALKNEFKYVYVYQSKTGGDFIFIASQIPVKLNLELIRSRFKDNKIKEDFFSLFNIKDEYEFFNLFLANNESIDTLLKTLKDSVKSNTDDNSYLEFVAARNFFLSTEKTLNIDMVNFFTQTQGVSMDDIHNSPKNIYALIIPSISAILNRAFFNEDNLSVGEKKLALKQILIYAQKNYLFNPATPESSALLGTTLIDNGKIDEGFHYLLEAESKNFNQSYLYNSIAKVYNRYMMKSENIFDPESGLKNSLKAVSLDKNNPQSNFLVGVSYFNLGMYSKALPYFKKYYDISVKSKISISSDFYQYYTNSVLYKDKPM